MTDNSGRTYIVGIRHKVTDSSPQINLRQSGGCSPTAQASPVQENEKPFGGIPFHFCDFLSLPEEVTDDDRASIMLCSILSKIMADYVIFVNRKTGFTITKNPAKKHPFF